MDTQQLYLTGLSPAASEPQREQQKVPPVKRHEYTPTLRDYPLDERPVQRLHKYGPGALSTGELYAVLAGGPRQIEAMRSLMEYSTTGALSPIANVARAPMNELQQIHYIGPAAAARIKAAFELGRRLTTEAAPHRTRITCPASAVNLIEAEMALLEQEQMRVMCLSTKNDVICIETVYQGSLNTVLIREAELFRTPIRVCACGVIIFHNHPSGDPTPSPEDIRSTERIVAAGEMLDIEVMDHIIIGHHRWISLKERRLGFR